MREFSMDAHLESSGHCQFLSHVRSNLATGLQNSHVPRTHKHTNTAHTHTLTHTLAQNCHREFCCGARVKTLPLHLTGMGR